MVVNTQVKNHTNLQQSFVHCLIQGIVLQVQMLRDHGSRTLESLIVIAGLRPVAEGLTDVTVRSFIIGTAVIGGVWWGVQHLVLGGTVLCVVQVKAVTYVTEETGRGFLFIRWLGVTRQRRQGCEILCNSILTAFFNSTFIQFLHILHINTIK